MCSMLEPLDSQGQPLLGDDGRAMRSAEHLDQLRLHARPLTTGAARVGFGEVINCQPFLR